MAHTQDTYPLFLQKVLDDLRSTTGQVDIPSIYHRIRRIPYGGAGQRDPRLVYERNLGTCSGKHILLRDVLRAAGFEADVVTIFTHFNKGIPVHGSMSAELQHIIQNTDVPDYHHYVLVCGNDGETMKLDATWHDALQRFNFPVNDTWDGVGDTRLAGDLIKTFPAEEDVAQFKRQMLATISDQELTHRARFLELLTQWIATVG